MDKLSLKAPQELITKVQHALDRSNIDGESYAVSAFEAAPPLWTLDVYCDDNFALGLIDHIFMDAANQSSSVVYTRITLPDSDWVAMSLEDLPPVRAGRFVVFGAHDAHKVRAGEIALHIEASAAFGTGHHQTTSGCLIALDRLLNQRRFHTALDIGTGTGVLAIALAKVQHTDVLGTEIDPRSVVIARENIAANGVRDCVSISGVGDLKQAPHIASRYDLILGNILAPTLVTLADDIARLSHVGTVLVLSGILNWQARKVFAHFAARGFAKRFFIQKAEWSTLVLEKFR